MSGNDDVKVDQDLAQKQAKKRRNIVSEIISTEKSYVAKLEMCNDAYVTPLTELCNTNKEILEKKIIQKIFSYLPSLAPLNKDFLKELEKRFIDWKDDTCIGDLFGSFAKWLKMYTEYIKNHENATQTLAKIKSQRKWVNFQNTTFEQCKGVSVDSLLIEPIQRVPRYKLLLAELLKHTKGDHPDYKNIQEALVAIDAVAHHFNDSLHESLKQTEVLNIQKQFSGSFKFISPGRRFLKKGALTKVCRKADKKYTFFLFNDLLCYGSKAAKKLGFSKYKLHQAIDIKGAFYVQDMKDGDAEQKHKFQIISVKKSFAVYCKDDQSKKEWLEALYDVIEKCKNAGITNKKVNKIMAPVWQPDNSSNGCYVCDKEFNFLKRRRHHCRLCGNLVCADCSRSKMILAGDKKNKQRVCNKCVETWKKKKPGVVQNPEPSDKNQGKNTQDKKKDTPDTKTGESTEYLWQCKALYPFSARDKNELTIEEGDVINIIEKDGDRWWKGELNGKKGFFPANYVEPLEGGDGVEIYQVCVAVAGYDKTDDQELSLQEGDKVRVRSKDPSGWWNGINERTGEKGWFPENRVQQVDDDTSSSDSDDDDDGLPTAKVLYSYTKTCAKELTIKQGEIVDILKIHEGGWWKVSKQSTDGSPVTKEDQGWVPSTYIQEM